MRLFSIDIKCTDPECGHIENLLIDPADKDGEFWCPMCAKEATRMIGCPMVLKESYPDGMRRARFRQTHEQYKIESALKKARKKDKPDLKKELDKIKGVKK